MMKNVFLLLVITFYSIGAFSQMWNGVDTLYGNEWIDYSKAYYKFKVANDGVYRITFNELKAVGVPVDDIKGADIQIFSRGKEVPLFVTSSEQLESDDFFELYCKKNRSELDTFLFENTSDLINIGYSLYSDTSVYFLTWDSAQNNKRFDVVLTDIGSTVDPESFFWATSKVVNTEILVSENYSGAHYSHYEKEGFSSRLRKTNTIELEVDDVFQGANLEAEVRLNFVLPNGNHFPKVDLNGNVLFQDSINRLKWSLETLSLNVDPTILNETNEVTIDGSVNADRNSLSAVSITYPRGFASSDTTIFHFSYATGMENRFFEISGLSNARIIGYDILNNNRFIPKVQNGKVTFTYGKDLDSISVVLIAESSISNKELLPTIFIDYSQENGDYVLVSHPDLRKGNSDEIANYANYRASSNGGSHMPAIVDILQIYDQYGYGVPNHPIGLRNFIFDRKLNQNNLKWVLILGKGLQYSAVRGQDQINALSTRNFIPTIGFPGADNLFTTFNNKDSMIVSIGRLPIRKSEELKVYLNKLKDYELNRNLPQTIEDKSWMKKIAHLGGGLPAEQAVLRYLLDQLALEVENNQFGADVQSFYKTSTDPIQNSQSTKLSELINDGLAIMTYFGHSYAGGLGFSIERAETFNNKGRYPLILSYGCFSGQVHIENISVGEEFVFAENAGAIGFVASTGFGDVVSLHQLGERLYKNLGGAFYRASIGEIIQESVNQYQRDATWRKQLNQQNTLTCDPALKIFSQPGIDLTIDKSSIKIEPEVISTQLDSFEISLDILNLGSYILDSTTLLIDKISPSGERLNLVNEKIIVPPFKSAQKFSISNFNEEEGGEHRFTFEIDPENQIEELPNPLAENNNVLLDQNGNEGVDVLYYSDEVIPVYPIKYSIISGIDNFQLTGVGSNIFKKETNYFFQLDTTANFDSPLLSSETVTAEGAIVSWNPNISFLDKTEYFWRIRPDTVGLGKFLWNESSFKIEFDSDEAGWNQSHFQQFDDNRLANIKIDSTKGKIEFVDDFKDIFVRNTYFGNQGNYATFFINTERFARHTGTPSNGIFVIPLDSISLEPLGYHRFATNNLTRRQIAMDFIRDSIADKNFVVFFTLQRQISGSYEPEEWRADSIDYGTNLFEILENEGAQRIRETESMGSLPYIFMYQKGVSPLGETLADSVNQIIELRHSVMGSWYRGQLTSVPIGPSKNWDKLTWKNSRLETSDSISLEVIGITQNNKDSILFRNITDEITDISSIDSKEFPEIKIRIHYFDSLNRTIPALQSLKVLYEGVPEFALDPQHHLVFFNDTLAQGDSLFFEIGVNNISDWISDSINITFDFQDSNNEIISNRRVFSPLDPLEKDIIKFSFPTIDLAGSYNFHFEVNTPNPQQEVTTINNQGVLDFIVLADNTNPLLDVTFDGIHILNGDIISPEPLILIELKDENNFFPLTDTTLFSLSLKYPNRGDYEDISYSSNQLTFTPADLNNGDNKVRIEFKPVFVQDGIYQLRINGKDNSNNFSGLSYEIQFEVITKNAISNIINYPNPFSTATQFVYTKTGIDEMVDFKIQIFNVSGRVVKEIGKEDFGTLRVGTHKSEFVWDGTDNFGDPLANGVYLYKVVTPNASMDKLETSVDQYFKEGFGKMVILR